MVFGKRQIKSIFQQLKRHGISYTESRLFPGFHQPILAFFHQIVKFTRRYLVELDKKTGFNGLRGGKIWSVLCEPETYQRQN